MKNLNYILYLFFVFCIFSCRSNPKPSSNYMILDEVVYVDQFPKVFNLNGGETIDLGIIGTQSMSIHDSLLIVTTRDGEGMWSFFTLPDHNYLGKYLIKGRGPNEFFSPPSVEKQLFFEKHEELFANIYEFNTGKLYLMNISETLRNNKLSMHETDHSLPRYIRFSILNDTTFLCNEINENQTQRIRYLLVNGEKKSSQNFEKLNKASIDPEEDINILATQMEKSPDGKRIVEIGISLNQINLYSIDDSLGKTICVGKHVDNISQIQQMNREDRIYSYVSAFVYPDFFCALYLNDTNKNYQQEKIKSTEIQFFDWEGYPLAKVNIDHMITSLAIDFIQGSLYTLNILSEELYKYDIHEILEHLFLIK